MTGSPRITILLVVGLILVVLAGISTAKAQCYENRWIPCGRGNCLVGVEVPCYDAAAEAQRQWNATATAQNKLAIDAAERGDWPTAEKEFKKCLQFWPHDPVILNSIANAEQMQGAAAFARKDYDAALKFYQESMVNEPQTDKYYQTMLANYKDVVKRVEAIHARQAEHLQDAQTAQHIDQSIQGFTQSLNETPVPDGLDFDDGAHPKTDGLALKQARVAAASPRSADCIFNGANGCGAPVALVKIAPGHSPVPADVVKFIDSIPQTVREMPAVKSNLELYEHLASVRGQIQNQMAADAAAARAHPDDESAKLKVMEDSGHLSAAKEDEKKARARVSMSISLIPQSPAASQ